MICKICKEDKPKDSFFKKTANPTGYQVMCKKCDNEGSRIRKIKKREENWNRLMKDIGGQQCSICGFTDEYRGCFDLHHIDDTLKEHGISKLLAGSYDRIKAEADKCVLVCSNCHRKIHRRDK